MQRRALVSYLLASLCLLLSTHPAAAQIIREDYTFLTFAGPQNLFFWSDGSSNVARFNNPSGVAVDSSSNICIVESPGIIRRITPGGVMSTLAGQAGIRGTNDGIGGAASFTAPIGCAFDPGRNLYVSDNNNHTIRKVTPAGVVTTFAGLPGVSGTNDGTGGTARFANPQGVAVDSQTNVYVCDTANHLIRKITSAGVVTTLAGFPKMLGTNDGLGTVARFRFPDGLAVDSLNNVWVADTGNALVRKVTPAGLVSTIAGQGQVFNTNDGPGSVARFSSPFGVVIDTANNVYVTDQISDTVRKITPGGVVSTIAGVPLVSGYANGPAATALFSNPKGIGIDPAGNLYVADGGSALRKISSGVVSSVFGQGLGFGTNDGTGYAASFNGLTGLAVDGATNLYVVDSANCTIRKVTRTGVVSTFVGLPTVSGTNDGTGNTARFNFPIGIAVGPGTNLYVADTSSQTIRKVTPAGVVTTLAGLAGITGTNDGTGSAARFSFPNGIAVDAATNVYVADSNGRTIRKINSAGTVITLAGVGNSSGTNDGVGATARFNSPNAIALDSATNLYVTETFAYTVRKVTPDGVVTTIAGLPLAFGSNDGPGIVARFNQPRGIALDTNGDLLVTDANSHTIRKVTPAGMVTTLAGLAGNQLSVNYIAEGSGSAARFAVPHGIATDTAGNVYVSDNSYYTIFKGYPAPPDLPVVTPDSGRVGLPRQLDVANLTTTSWEWSILRKPASSTAQLSAANVRNPTFTPDVPDLFVLQLKGTNAAGKVVMQNLNILPDHALDIATSNNVARLSLYGLTGANYAVDYVGAVPASNNWSSLPTVTLTNLPHLVTDTLTTSNRFYRLRLVP